MSARDVAEWQAFAQLEPLGLERVELYLAQLTAVVAQGLLPRKGRAWQVDDFVLRWESKPRKTQAELVAMFKALGARLTGRKR